LLCNTDIPVGQISFVYHRQARRCNKNPRKHTLAGIYYVVPTFLSAKFHSFITDKHVGATKIPASLNTCGDLLCSADIPFGQVLLCSADIPFGQISFVYHRQARRCNKNPRKHTLAGICYVVPTFLSAKFCYVIPTFLSARFNSFITDKNVGATKIPASIHLRGFFM
jgi:hypothetical protein